MLLVEFTINAVLNRLSQQGIALTNYWEGKISGFDSPQFQLDQVYGGYCRLGWGSISFFPDLFDDDWPPPINGVITVKYTGSTEGAAETLFTGTAHLAEITQTEVTFDIYGDDEDTNLLEEGANYNGDTVPYPRAFGTVTHVNPVRLADAGGGNQRYDLGHIQGTEHVNWHAFDDGVDICGNVENVANNVFELNAAPVGEVTLTGTGEDTTLKDVMDWACGASYLNYSFDHTYDRASSPNTAYWANTQTVMVDFLSDLCAFFTHLFYIRTSTLYLVDMLLDNGSQTFTEFQYLPSIYSYNPPIATIKSEWETRVAGEWSQPGGGAAAAVYVKKDNIDTVRESSYPYGEEIDMSPFQDTRSVINTALDNIITVTHKPKTSLRIPFTGSLPAPGKKISWTDTALGQSTDMWIRTRNITYEFDKEIIEIEGEGAIAAT